MANIKIQNPHYGQCDSDSSSIADITGGFTPLMDVSSSQSSISGEEDDSFTPAVQDPSVIVGMACRLPGAGNPHDLWKVLSEKVDLQKKMPEDRFNVDGFYHPQGTNKGTVSAGATLLPTKPRTRWRLHFW